jgi:hypothetical protein
MTDEQQPQMKETVAEKPVQKKPAKPPVAPKQELTQAIADAIMARDPKEGRSKIATDLGIPASWVWIVRTATQQTKVSQETVMKNRLTLKRKGIKVRAPRTTKPKS